MPSAQQQRRTEQRFWRIVGAATLALLVLGALAGWLTLGVDPAPTADHPLIVAVLPFANLSSDASRQYLADGLTESLMTDLARLPELRVVSRTSVRRYKDSDLNLREIAAELGADRIVEGAVLQVDNRLRISAQLIDARSDRHLWAKSFEYSAEDVLKLQQEVSAAVADEMRRRLGPQPNVPSRRLREVDPEAYASYVRGRLAAFEWTAAGAQRSVAEFERALTIDPAYAEAHAGLAVTYGFLSLNGAGMARNLWPMARAEAERALALDEELDQAHTALGFVEAAYDWNWGGAERSFLRALELNSGSVDARHALAMTVMAPQGRIDEAIRTLREALALDPNSPALNNNLADLLALRGDHDAALEQYAHTLELQPEFEEAWVWLGFTYLRLGRMDEARAAWERVQQIQGGGSPATQAFVELAKGDREQARQLLEESVAAAPEPTEAFAPWCMYATGFCLLGEKDKALKALENAYVQRSSQLLMIKVSPNFQSLHGHERFSLLLRGMNLED